MEAQRQGLSLSPSLKPDPGVLENSSSTHRADVVYLAVARINQHVHAAAREQAPPIRVGSAEPKSQRARIQVLTTAELPFRFTQNVRYGQM